VFELKTKHFRHGIESLIPRLQIKAHDNSIMNFFFQSVSMVTSSFWDSKFRLPTFSQPLQLQYYWAFLFEDVENSK